MKPFHLLFPALFLVLGACRAAPAVSETSAAPSIPAPLQPPSVLAALLRLLETAESCAPPACEVQVRALEADALLDRAEPAEFVRAFLHLTVFSADAGRARAGMEELERSLRDEAASVGRGEDLSRARVERAFSAPVWRAPKREDLVSYSAALRFEVAPGHLMDASASSAAAATSAATESARTYVENIARELALPVHALPAHAQVARGHANELRCRLRPAEPDGGHTSSAIASFLRELEARSPAARVTHLRLERSSEVPDAMRDDAWTFEAELTLRVPQR